MSFTRAEKSNIFFNQKSFSTSIFLDPPFSVEKNFYFNPKTFFDPVVFGLKFIWIKRNFWPEIFLQKIYFWTQFFCAWSFGIHFFLTQTFLESKISYLNIFGPIAYFDPKFFWTWFFFRPTFFWTKNFWTQSFLESTFFWTLHCLEQRKFYAKFSLLLALNATQIKYLVWYFQSSY